jgi:hypothetical protein
VRGAFPAASRTVAASSTTPNYLGPYYIVRRDSNGKIDTTFGDNGYISVFGNSADSSYRFTSLCIDPGTGNIVIVGQETTSGAPVGVVERLLQPAGGSDIASLDTSFNATGTTPGVVTISTPNGNNNPTLYGCSVAQNGPGAHDSRSPRVISSASAASLGASAVSRSRSHRVLGPAIVSAAIGRSR